MNKRGSETVPEGEAVRVRREHSVGWQGEDKGRMDRCCCQDLSAVTNGCRKDEASKTLENSDVVNHRLECVCARAHSLYVRRRIGGRVGELKRVCVCESVCVWMRACSKVCPKLRGANPWRPPLQDGRLAGNWFRWCLRATEMNLRVWLQEKNSKQRETEMAEQWIKGGKGK